MDVLVRPGIGVVTVGMRGALRMTLFSRRQRYKGIEYFKMRFWIGPILRDTSPLCAEAFLIGIGILDDERLHPLRMRQNDAEADWPAVVMKVEAAFVDFELLEE